VHVHAIGRQEPKHQPAISRQTQKLALIPCGKKGKYSASGVCTKLSSMRPGATTVVAPQSVGSVPTKGQMKPTSSVRVSQRRPRPDRTAKPILIDPVAKRPTPTQSTCLYYVHDNEASKCVQRRSNATGLQLELRLAATEMDSDTELKDRVRRFGRRGREGMVSCCGVGERLRASGRLVLGGA
jgi:hypothetical protein